MTRFVNYSYVRSHPGCRGPGGERETERDRGRGRQTERERERDRKRESD